jgi:hypothetical protein
MKVIKRKKYIRIDRETGSNEIFAMLDEIGSDNESDVENLLEDSDTEYVEDMPVPETGNNEENHHQLLAPDANIHVIETPTTSESEPPRKKLKEKINELKWKRTGKFVTVQDC